MQGIMFSSCLASDMLKVPSMATPACKPGTGKALQAAGVLGSGSAARAELQAPPAHQPGGWLESQRTLGVRERDPSPPHCPWLLFWAKKSKESTLFSFLH